MNMNRLEFTKKIYRFGFGYRNYVYKTIQRPDPASKKLTAPQIETDRSQSKNVKNHIKNRILSTGPITVADYMREVLTNPYSGYYMNRDMFGKEGDFITSPEISQIFGELIAIWILSEWEKIGSPSPFQIVELGPGRGTLSRDILRVLTRFKLSEKFSMHLVEISPFLSKLQGTQLCFKINTIEDKSSNHYQTGQTVSGTEVFWYKRLEDVPEKFSIIIAHEFFDALPIHKLQNDNGVWKEILIDVKNDGTSDDFHFVMSKNQTPVSHIYKPIEGENRSCLEYSLETDRIIHMLADRIQKDGGISLIMDYGHFGEKCDTFRAFKQHKLHDPLIDPGTADLTADVDFRQIKHVAETSAEVITYGPIEQNMFLKNMQGEVRLEQLLMHALPENKSKIQSGYDMLTDPNKMGVRFKFLSLFPAVLQEHLKKFPVNGFH